MQFFERLVRRLGMSHCIGWRSRRMIGGKLFSIPFLGGVRVNEKENWFSRYLAAFMEWKGGLFVDVGVNLGQTLLKVKAIDLDRSYVGFEASVECIHYARELVRVNRFTNVTLIPVALAEKQQLVRFSSNSDTDESASIVPGFRDSAYNHSAMVLAEKGDDIIPLMSPQPVGIIKVDVEGAELEVLMGLRQTLASAIPIVTCEILPVYDASIPLGQFRMKRQAELMSLMQTLGYACFRMRHDAGLVPVGEIEVHSDLDLCDYVFLPQDLVARADSLR